MSKFTDVIEGKTRKEPEPDTRPEVRAHLMRVEWGDNNKKRDRRWVIYLDSQRILKCKPRRTQADAIALIEAKYKVKVVGVTRYTGTARPSEMAMQIASHGEKRT